MFFLSLLCPWSCLYLLFFHNLGLHLSFHTFISFWTLFQQFELSSVPHLDNLFFYSDKISSANMILLNNLIAPTALLVTVQCLECFHFMISLICSLAWLLRTLKLFWFASNFWNSPAISSSYRPWMYLCSSSSCTATLTLLHL